MVIPLKKIAVLDQNTIDKIAAGEVVERPSSVVKELVENAIDAGATAITVEITDGGKKLIRITDNGSGMDAEQVPLAFLRHATSKIEKVEDLTHIASLGFRGEALSSIAAVSQVELITKTPSGISGTRYVIEGGKEQSLEEMGAPEGKPQVFVIGGNGMGIPTYRRLQRAGIPFAAGIIHKNDVDYEVAKALAAEVICEEPFEMITGENLVKAQKLMDRCGEVICCVDKFGPMNEGNRKLVEKARQDGKLKSL